MLSTSGARRAARQRRLGDRRAARHPAGVGGGRSPGDGRASSRPTSPGGPGAQVEVIPPPTAATAGEATVVLSPERPPGHRAAVLAWAALVGVGALLLVAALADVGPGWLDGVGAASVAVGYTWGLAARTGGRPVVFGLLALLISVVVVATDQSVLRTGAAVLTCVVSAVLAVMVTRPAVSYTRAATEVVTATAVAVVGALATLGFDPVVSVARFEYVTLGLSMVGAFGVVHRLGAGLHGLGRRGVGAVLVGGLLLSLSLLYAELLRHYGPLDAVDHLLSGVHSVRHHLGAFPRPIETVVGVPALAWGVHMRARRRQGWWLCAFGVAATAPVANSLVNPTVPVLEAALSATYALVVGLLIGWVVVRIDLAVTGSRGHGGRRSEQSTAVRPEPPRTEPLL